VRHFISAIRKAVRLRTQPIEIAFEGLVAALDEVSVCGTL
jgi:hypothetical protein